MTSPSGTPAPFLDGLTDARLLAILRGSSAAATVDTALTLLDEGFRYLEVSLNTENALDVIAQVAARAPSGATIGAGTVLSADDVRRVRDAGGSFIVTPVIADSVAEGASLGMPVLAGALTPSEALQGMSLGATAIKLFPVSIGGPAYLSAVRDPLPHIPFIPVGGVTADLAGDYFARGAVAVGLGSPLIGDAAAGGSLDDLRTRARQFLSVAERSRPASDAS
ncbi:bifunctional 4-hydroxy-2-oxoglutarate aldolase/2-dehydro-3-deoxy-phosphogluconate aldolase [Planctomonas psychrotolerans]|uniref:bifunctional 4-hydroxy-2-oxoglutarate aldolase/2-dehydro-3-deoxy-phosphogluconate aldolase n=1 Tax=Planctomonas psychrotolerans TaxID=2528712 RepID=UPI0012395C8A|nr:bifunctional 4-hydroxy-2-oxoglutarate aldolase/2-dehydro-3-deoxy-phosphogluconate aldolase [Planctomonas psychrotolerans]